MTGPSAAAADATSIDDEANTDRADQHQRYRQRQAADPRVFIARETVCPYACSSEPGHCSWNCAPLSIRSNEVTA